MRILTQEEARQLAVTVHLHKPRLYIVRTACAAWPYQCAVTLEAEIGSAPVQSKHCSLGCSALALRSHTHC